jgi:hypothetical protein
VTIFVSRLRIASFNGDYDPSHDVVEEGHRHRREGVGRPEKAAHDPFRSADAHSDRIPLDLAHPFYLAGEEDRARLFDQVAVDHTAPDLDHLDRTVLVAAHDRLESGLAPSGPDPTLVHLDPDFCPRA